MSSKDLHKDCGANGPAPHGTHQATRVVLSTRKPTIALLGRTLWALLPLCAGVTLACTKATWQPRHTQPYVELAANGPAGSPKATFLVFMPETKQTNEVLAGLSDELAKDYRVIAVRIDQSQGVPTIAQGIDRHKPAAVVLMNNPTVAAYREYQRTTHLNHYPPAVVVMTSFLDGQSPSIRDWVGISYEVPLITAVTNLRKLVSTPTDRVGVVVRPALREFVDRQSALAKREQISVAVEEVSANPNNSEIKRAIRRLKGVAHVIWVLNDDHLLSPHLIAEGWLPELNERPWVPTIVGASSLVSPELSFGTFAVLPDHTALGTQTADVLYKMADSHFSLDGTSAVQLPLSITSTVDLTQAQERFALRDQALQQVDRVLQ
jgi:hypothetical protein